MAYPSRLYSIDRLFSRTARLVGEEAAFMILLKFTLAFMRQKDFDKFYAKVKEVVSVCEKNCKRKKRSISQFREDKERYFLVSLENLLDEREPDDDEEGQDDDWD